MIKNLTQKTLVCEDYFEPKSFFGNLKGMIGDNFKCIVIKTRFGIHTFFMEKSIDIIVLDHKNRVAHVKKVLAPNNLFFWNPTHDTIIELEAGLIDKSKTKVGDNISFE